MTAPGEEQAPTFRVAAVREIAAPAAAAWAVLADYREGHPSILPRPWIDGLEVVEGGRGAGTLFDVRLREWGKSRTLRMRVSEPEPGRVLEERDVAGGIRTTFTVDPSGDGTRCRVEIATRFPRRAGAAGTVERWLLGAAAPQVFREELALLARRLEPGLPPTEPRFLFRWVRDCALGWLVGLVLVVLLAQVAEAIGVGGVQGVVGIGMGAALGLLQGRRLRGALGAAGPWAVASTAGMGLPFVAADLLGALAGVPYLLAVGVPVGGLLAGLLQERLLRPRYPAAGLWIPASLVSWSVGGGAVLLADGLGRSPSRGTAGGIAALALWVGGGALLGLPGGLALRRVLGGKGP